MRKRRLLLVTSALSTAALLQACQKQQEVSHDLPGNPKGSHYDEGMSPTPDAGATTEGAEAVDAGNASDAAVFHVPTPPPGEAGVPTRPLPASPKGSFYDGGLPSPKAAEVLSTRRSRRRARRAPSTRWVMLEPSIEWFGGVAERHFRKVRPGVDAMPWGTLEPSRYPPELVDRARVAWTEAAYNEYCTAAAFAEMLSAMLAAKAPVDLIGMASDFVADEMLHVELTSRIAMELGGGAPYEIDFTSLNRRPSATLSPLQRASELVVHVCCVGEAFAAVSRRLRNGRASAHPRRPRADRRRRGAARPPRLALPQWLDDRLDDAERRRIADVAIGPSPPSRALAAPRERVEAGRTSEGYLLARERLGFTDVALGRARTPSNADPRAPRAPRDRARPERLAALL